MYARKNKMKWKKKLSGLLLIQLISPQKIRRIKFAEKQHKKHEYINNPPSKN